jgi:hypothetical protein
MAIGYAAFRTATERRTGVRLLTGAPARHIAAVAKHSQSSCQDNTIPTPSGDLRLNSEIQLGYDRTYRDCVFVLALVCMWLTSVVASGLLFALS